ncbi:hypothetical protein SAMN04488589_0620 [Methanolobus vulcani]|uniref:Uncharacterized protein n=1 Tax=Methanolobus vulcani TaxID=38026 RepID=A0A7Z7AV99_9EURY|nr:hypothetical protein [Methanolobus vulcani]SDF47074.1 hypothetical protein SAMN04488589_0620 [Methanolobus vulcani]
MLQTKEVTESIVVKPIPYEEQSEEDQKYSDLGEAVVELIRTGRAKGEGEALDILDEEYKAKKKQKELKPIITDIYRENNYDAPEGKKYRWLYPYQILPEANRRYLNKHFVINYFSLEDVSAVCEILKEEMILAGREYEEGSKYVYNVKITYH